MVITKENIGDVVCEYSSGKRFLINNMSDGYIYCLEENGENTCIMAQEDSYGIETDENRIASFHNNVALAQALDAAELAALRRLVPGQYDFREQQEAARVLEIVDDQRTIFLSRLRYERSTTKAGAPSVGKTAFVLNLARNAAVDFTSASFLRLLRSFL